jgi:hypothetical protein
MLVKGELMKLQSLIILSLPSLAIADLKIVTTTPEAADLARLIGQG